MKKCLLIAIGTLGLTACDAVEDAQHQAGDAVMSSMAEDQIKVYEIAKRNGDAMEACTQGMAIAQIYLQAKDETSWKEWKSKSEADCKAAGLPSM